MFDTCALATPVGTSIRHARAPGSEVVIQDDDFFDDFQCQLDELAAARQMWQLPRDTRGSRALIGRCEVHAWSAGGVFGETRPFAGGDLRMSNIVSEYLHCFLPDGELPLVQDKLSVMAGARARTHAGAAAHQQSFRVGALH